MDLCAVFCPANTRLVQSIVQRAYDHMPLFFNMEAKETFKAITTAILKLSLNLTGPSSPLKDLASVLDMQNYLEVHVVEKMSLKRGTCFRISPGH